MKRKRMKRKRMKRKIKIIFISSIVFIVLVVFGVFFYCDRRHDLLKLEKQKEKNQLIGEIKKHYSTFVKVPKDSILYVKKKSKFQKIGKVSGGRTLTLKKIELNDKTEYFPVDGCDYYISYQDVHPIEEAIPVDERFQHYLPFNLNVVTKNPTSLYQNGKVVFSLDISIDAPVIKKDDDGYWIQYGNELFLVLNQDIVRTYEKENTTLPSAKEVPVTVYHFIYLEGDNGCNESICHSEAQIREQFQYLKENQYFTLTTQELGWFLESKIQLPEHSILITIDDGARAENFIPLLEEFQINATLFLISSWYPKEKFSSSYLELASHTHDLHRPGKCPGGQGSPLKCLDKQELLNDLKTSRDTLGGTEAFCFPFYEYNDYAIEVVKEAGFRLGFIGGMKKASPGVNPYKIPRISMNRNTTLSEYISYIQ